MTRQTKYQVQGLLPSSHCPPVCWEGWTQDRDLAVERLATAKAYSVTRGAEGGQRVLWEIAEIVVAAPVAERMG